MIKHSLILIGGGGHCRSCIDVIEQEGRYAIHGILDATEVKGAAILGYPVLGNDDLLGQLIEEDHHFLVTVGQIKSAAIRIQLFEKLQMRRAKLATVISPKAYVSRSASIAAGTIVLHGAIINTGNSVGFNTIINSRALVEHDSRIGNHVHISTGVTINGGCSVDDGSFIGSCSVIANNINIGTRVIIGAGSVVIKDVLEEGVYAGNPSKKINNE
jgi:sugar O-acyltransferase (sialic acid O-acetyltransferase NeuD family)